MKTNPIKALIDIMYINGVTFDRILKCIDSLLIEHELTIEELYDLIDGDIDPVNTSLLMTFLSFYKSYGLDIPQINMFPDVIDGGYPNHNYPNHNYPTYNAPAYDPLLYKVTCINDFIA